MTENIGTIVQEFEQYRGFEYTAFGVDAAELCSLIAERGYLDWLNHLRQDPWVDLDLQYAACSVAIASFLETSDWSPFPSVRLTGQFGLHQLERTIAIRRGGTEDSRTLRIPSSDSSLVYARYSRYWQVPKMGLASGDYLQDTVISLTERDSCVVGVYPVERAGAREDVYVRILTQEGHCMVEEPVPDTLTELRPATLDEARLFDLVAPILGRNDYSLSRG